MLIFDEVSMIGRRLFAKMMKQIRKVGIDDDRQTKFVLSFSVILLKLHQLPIVFFGVRWKGMSAVEPIIQNLGME